MAETITFDSLIDKPTTLDAQAQNDRLSAITHDAFNDGPAALAEQEQSDRFDAIAASLGNFTVPELVAA